MFIQTCSYEVWGEEKKEWITCDELATVIDKEAERGYCAKHAEELEAKGELAKEMVDENNLPF